jgi:hypothetical protein
MQNFRADMLICQQGYLEFFPEQFSLLLEWVTS